MTADLYISWILNQAEDTTKSCPTMQSSESSNPGLCNADDSLSVCVCVYNITVYSG